MSSYVDFNGSDHNGTEINGQPQLLLDVGQLFGISRARSGVELYLHRHCFRRSSVP
ncbi:MAG: hypothetical protein Q9M26_04030 [Mariprofundales bacterium]|nr:hypothetical protein [Mariprofundales bacterium]